MEMSGSVNEENVLKSPFSKKGKKEAKFWMLLLLIAFDVHLCPVCFLSEVELSGAGQCVGLSTDEQACMSEEGYCRDTSLWL